MLDVVTLVLISIMFFFAWVNKDRKLYPPGPYEYPFIGSKMVVYVDEAKEMQKKYGDLFSVRLGNCRFVYITDYKLSKEVFSRAEFSGRAQWSIIHVTEKERREKNSIGVILSNGERWQHNRRFLLRHLRDLGMGKSRMEMTILEATEEIISELKSTNAEPTKIPFAMNVAILNIVWSLIAGQRFDKDNLNEVNRLITNFNDAQETFTIAGLVEFFPIIKKIFPTFILEKYLHTSMYIDAVTTFETFIQPVVDEHIKNLDVDNPNDIIDDYLIDMNQEKDVENSLFSKEDLLRNIWDMFIAGIDTTSLTISYFILYMAKYQEEQSKVQALLDDVVPKGSLPGLEHREQLVYLDALLNEVTRMASFASFGVNHIAVKDTEINGYLIPKDSILFSVAGVSHYDPRYWNNPEMFDPTRFISEDGKFISHKDGFQPFGLGRRQCLGESLARMELYLIAAAIMKNFTISPCPGKDVDLKPTNVPIMQKPNLDQKLVFMPRN